MRASPSFPEQHCNVEGIDMRYIEAGHGEAIMLIHGSLCDYRYWRWQVDDLAKSFRVIAPSLPGCWPTPLQRTEAYQSGESRYGIAQHVHAIIALIQKLVPDGVIHLLGHSRGAQIALEASLAMPDREGRLVLADPGFAFANEQVDRPVHRDIVSKLAEHPLDAVLGEFVDAVNGAGTWRRTVPWFKDMVRANAWTLVPQMQELHLAVDPQTVAETLTRPVLLIGGEQSPPRYGSRIDILERILNDAQREVVPRAAHGMNLANAPYFNEALRRFLLPPPT